MKFHTLKPSYVDVEFASVDELIRCSNLEDGYVNPKSSSKQAASRREVHLDRRSEAAGGRDDWYQDITTEEKLAKATANPPDWLIDGGKRCLASINAAIGSGLQTPAKRRRRIGVEDGDTVNIDRYLMRSPEPWERMEQHRNTSPIIRITFDMVTSGGSDKEDLLWGGDCRHQHGADTRQGSQDEEADHQGHDQARTRESYAFIHAVCICTRWLLPVRGCASHQLPDPAGCQ